MYQTHHRKLILKYKECKLIDSINNKIMNVNETDNTHLPFVERFRPKKLDDVMSHQDIIITLKNFINQHNIPHLMFYGPPGTGKTSTIESFVNELYGEDNVEYMTMNINASEERGIEIVRNKIKNFVSTLPIYNNSSNGPKYKFVILDEADAMTSDAQAVLRQVIENYTYNARFCLICNCIKKINSAIQSRCTTFKFSPLDFDSVKKKIDSISNEYGINVSSSGVQTIWKLSNGDMRKVMHMLQVISINHKKIDSNTVTKFQKYPTKSHASKLYNTLLKGDVHKSIDVLEEIVNGECYSLVDIVNEMTHLTVDNIINGNLDQRKGRVILSNLRNIEMNIIATSDTEIQMYSVAAVFSLGVNN